MADVTEQFVEAVSLSGELGIVIDPDLLPDFDTSLHTREKVAKELAPVLGDALLANAEFSTSVPAINDVRREHLAFAEASLARAKREHLDSLIGTLRPSPRGAALSQAADNNLDASLQLGDVANSIIEGFGKAYRELREYTDRLDTEAPLLHVKRHIDWGSLAGLAINRFLEPPASEPRT